MEQRQTLAENGVGIKASMASLKGDVTKYDDITKLNFHTCLLHLAFEKEKIELEKQQIKRR